MARFLLTLLLLASALTAAETNLDQLVRSTVERARKEFNVPGISVAVIKDGRVLLSQGYGLRKLGEQPAMTANTLVGIASNTKAFSSAALAMLVDEGKLKWDDRVIDKLPEFAMSDAYVTREMRIRDLPCHRSGLALGAGDLMFWPASNLTPADVLYRLRFVPLETSFRSRYAYDNVLYNVIGAVVERVSGKSWAAFMEERFFNPLGMTSSLTSIRQLKPSDDAVAPHADVDGVLKPLEHQPLDNNAPAGAIVSSVNDMSRWVLTLLNKGMMPNGKRLISEAQLKVLWTPLIFIPRGELPEPLKEMKSNFAAYAMGEGIAEYRGHLTVSHTGGLAGMVTSVKMLPDDNIGVIVLTNQQNGAAFTSVENTIIDHLLGAPAKDWISAFQAVQKEQAKKAKDMVSGDAAKRNADSKPSLPLANYAGRFRDPWYGDVNITETAGKLTMQFSHTPGLTGTLEHWQYDTFIVRWKDRSLDADAYVTYRLDPQGKVEDVAMKAVSPTTDFSFDFHHLKLRPVSASAEAWD